MNDGFSKITGFILAAILLFVAPVRIAQAENKAISTIYIHTEVNRICEQIRNTGQLTDEMYTSFMDVLGTTLNNYKFKIYVYDRNNKLTTNKEIMECLENQGICRFDYGSFIRLEIYSGSVLKGFSGGMIKAYENN